MEAEKLPEVRLECFDERAAQEIIDRCDEVPQERRGRNSVEREGAAVVITYDNKMWPYDIAEMASELALAGDSESAQVLACL